MNAGRKLRFAELKNNADWRGDSFTSSPEAILFLGGVADIHVTSVIPGAVRGNHFHTRRREVLIVIHESTWELYWDEGENTACQRREFPGRGGNVILINPDSAHAIRNSGRSNLLIIGLSS